MGEAPISLFLRTRFQSTNKQLGLLRYHLLRTFSDTFPMPWAIVDYVIKMNYYFEAATTAMMILKQ